MVILLAEWHPKNMGGKQTHSYFPQFGQEQLSIDTMYVGISTL